MGIWRCTIVLGSLLVAGCSGLAKTDFESDAGTHLLALDSSRRTVYVNARGRICAEPPPDAVGSLFASLSGKGGVLGSSGEAQASFIANLDSIFDRSQGIQALRDGMYRLCELHANGAFLPGDTETIRTQMESLVWTINFVVPFEVCADMAAGILQPKILRTVEIAAASADGGKDPVYRDTVLQQVTLDGAAVAVLSSLLERCISTVSHASNYLPFRANLDLEDDLQKSSEEILVLRERVNGLRSENERLGKLLSDLEN